MRIGRLEVEVPDDWNDASLYSFVAPEPDLWGPGKRRGFRTNVVFQSRKVASGESLSACVDRLIQSTRDMFPEVVPQVSDGPPVAGQPCKRVVYTVKDDATGEQVCQVVYLFVVDGLEWQAAFSVAAADLPAWQDKFGAMISTIRPSR